MRPRGGLRTLTSVSRDSLSSPDLEAWSSRPAHPPCGGPVRVLGEGMEEALLRWDRSLQARRLPQGPCSKGDMCSQTCLGASGSLSPQGAPGGPQRFGLCAEMKRLLLGRGFTNTWEELLWGANPVLRFP